MVSRVGEEQKRRNRRIMHRSGWNRTRWNRRRRSRRRVNRRRKRRKTDTEGWTGMEAAIKVPNLKLGSGKFDMLLNEVRRCTVGLFLSNVCSVVDI